MLAAMLTPKTKRASDFTFLIMDASFPSQTMCDRLLVAALFGCASFNTTAASRT